MIKAFPKVKDRAAAVISRGVRMSCLIEYTWNFRLGTKRVSASLYSLRPCTKDFSAHHNTHHAALPFKLMKDGSVGPGDAIECPSAETAIVSAEILSRIEGTIGVAAFSRNRGHRYRPIRERGVRRLGIFRLT